MSTQTHDRWYLTPAVITEETDENGNVLYIQTSPKYSDIDNIVGYAGATIPPSEISDSYAELVQTYPDVDPWYLVRMYGQGTAGEDAINTVSSKDDTRTLADHANAVVPILRRHCPSFDRSVSEWARGFRVTPGNR